MRYFLAGWALFVILAVGLLGFRGNLGRKPPLEFFDDMDRQMKFRPQQPADFFGDNRSSRLPVMGTIARSESLNNVIAADANGRVFAFDDSPVTTGRVTGTTNFVELSPMQVNAEIMARGRQRYQINCQPCHGPLGDGNGVTKKLGMVTVKDLHEPRIVKMGDGELFSVITNGRNTMGPYAAQITIEDRWAIVAFVRALQLSRLGTIDDVPTDHRASLKK
ncbi:MAG: cytochrome c [Verrucomicrobiales bacterium]|nr:cytochrome c [Verrucomicrobiales bacterium]